MSLTYNIGDVFWAVEKRANFDAAKIKMTDDNGVEWYRYKEPKTIYTINRFTIIGKLTINVEGYSMWDDNDYTDHYSIQYDNGDRDTMWEEDMTPDSYYIQVFTTEDAARAYVEAEKAKE